MRCVVLSCVLFVVRYPLFVVCVLLVAFVIVGVGVVGSSLFVVCCLILLFDMCAFVGCWLLSVLCYLLFFNLVKVLLAARC